MDLRGSWQVGTVGHVGHNIECRRSTSTCTVGGTDTIERSTTSR